MGLLQQVTLNEDRGGAQFTSITGTQDTGEPGDKYAIQVRLTLNQEEEGVNLPVLLELKILDYLEMELPQQVSLAKAIASLMQN